MGTTALHSHIGSLERALLDPAVRADAARLDALIADDFLEIGAAGAVFDKANVLARLPDESGVVFEVDALRVHRVSGDVIRLLYTAVRRVGGGTRRSLRSFWWRLEANGPWRMIFHQGTPNTGAGTI